MRRMSVVSATILVIAVASIGAVAYFPPDQPVPIKPHLYAVTMGETIPADPAQVERERLAQVERDRIERDKLAQAGLDRRSPGRTDAACMSGDQFNRNAASWVNNVDWSQVQGAATFSHDSKLMMASVKIMDEMKRLGTPACPDLAPTYDQYVAATSPKPQPIPPAPAPPKSVATKNTASRH
jgi:hypothetical protein